MRPHRQQPTRLLCLEWVYSAIKRNKIVSVAEMWMDLESVIQSEVSHENKYPTFTHVCEI